MILGVDVHAGYQMIDWERVAKAGVRFAIVKCTLGNEPAGDDRLFARNVAGAKAAGILVGAYHFAFPLPSGSLLPRGRSPKEQAERFFTVSKGLGANVGELPPALDFEWPARWDKTKFVDANNNGVLDAGEKLVDQWARWGISAASISEWGLECLEHLKRLWGRVPMIYEYPHFREMLGEYGKGAVWTRYPLWIATYPESARATTLPPPGAKPILNAPWSDWAIWQFSADGSPMRIDGIPVSPIDRNVIRDEATLRRLAMLDDPDLLVQADPIGERTLVDWDIVRKSPYDEIA